MQRSSKLEHITLFTGSIDHLTDFSFVGLMCVRTHRCITELFCLVCVSF